MKVICSWRLRKKLKTNSFRLKVLTEKIAESAMLGLTENEILSLNFIGRKTMRRINREFLDHDYLTDVICFNYRKDADYIPGEDTAVEIFISPDIALERAEENPELTVESELLLYLTHAVLHAAGMNDSTPAEKALMRIEEQRILNSVRQAGFQFPVKNI